MAHSNGIITRPVVIDANGGDLGAVLGMSSNVEGDFFVNGNINPWAKYKPVRSTILGDTGESSLENTDYWKAADEKCGFSIPTNTSPGSSPSTYSGAWYKLLHSQLMWSYNRPSGGVTSQPFRRNDFDGYDHNALPIFSEPQAQTVMVGYDGTLVINYELNAGNSRSLAIGDIKVNSTALSQWYFGILIYDTSSHYTFKATERASVSLGAVTFTGMDSYAGKTVQVVPFLSSVSQSQGSASSGTIISCNLAPVQMNITAYTSGINVIWDEVMWNSGHTQVSYAISLYNDSSSSKTISNIIITLKDNIQTLGTRTVSSITVPAGSTVVLATGTFAVSDYSSSREYLMTIVSQGSTMIPYEEMGVEEPEPDPE